MIKTKAYFIYLFILDIHIEFSFGIDELSRTDDIMNFRIVDGC